MSAFRITLLSSALLLLAVGDMPAQGGRRTDILLYSRPRLPVYFGLEAGYGMWTNKASFGVSDRNIPCALFTDGDGAGPAGGVKGIIYFTRWVIFSPRLRYEERSGSFLTPIPGEPARNAANEIVMLEEEAQVDATMATLSLDLMVGIDIARTGIYIVGGPSGSLLSNGFYDYTERLLGPEGFTLGTTGETEQLLVRGESFPTYNQFAFDLRGGLGYLFRLGRWGFNPEFFYSYPLTSSLASPDEMTQTGMLGTFSILYNFGE